MQIIHEWNQGYHPRTSEYFADFVTQRVPGAKERAYQELLQKAREHRQQKVTDVLGARYGVETPSSGDRQPLVRAIR